MMNDFISFSRACPGLSKDSAYSSSSSSTKRMRMRLSGHVWSAGIKQAAELMQTYQQLFFKIKKKSLCCHFLLPHYI